MLTAKELEFLWQLGRKRPSEYSIIFWKFLKPLLRERGFGEFAEVAERLWESMAPEERAGIISAAIELLKTREKGVEFVGVQEVLEKLESLNREGALTEEELRSLLYLVMEAVFEEFEKIAERGKVTVLSVREIASGFREAAGELLVGEKPAEFLVYLKTVVAFLRYLWRLEAR